MNCPLVTYIIANSDYEEYLERCLESAVAQTYRNLQFCVIDNSTNKDSKQAFNRIVSKVFGHDKFLLNKLKVYNLDQPVGPSAARNVAIKDTIKETDFYAILDADDENYPTKVEKLVERMQESEHIGVVYADYHIYNTVTDVQVEEYKHPYRFHHLRRECIVHSGSLIRKQALLDVQEPTGFYDETLRVAEDFDLWLRISEKYMIVHVAEFLSFVRTQPRNSTDTVRQEIWDQCWRKVQQKAAQRNR